jgi:hypothetical protein
MARLPFICMPSRRQRSGDRMLRQDICCRPDCQYLRRCLTPRDKATRALVFATYPVLTLSSFPPFQLAMRCPNHPNHFEDRV